MDYELTIKVRNGRLMKALRAKGYETIADFAKAAMIKYSSVLQYFTMQVTPIGWHGGFKDSFVEMCEHLDISPYDACPPEVLNGWVNSNKPVTRSVSSSEFEAISAKVDINKALKLLTPLEEKILRMRFGLDGQPPLLLEEAGAVVGKGREHVRQIEARALRKLKHPSKRLKSYEQGVA